MGCWPATSVAEDVFEGAARGATRFAGAPVVEVFVGAGADDDDGAEEAAVVGLAGVFAAAESLIRTTAGGCRFDEENNIGVTTMTSAIKISARSVRLSIQAEAVARGRDRSRLDETDDSGRSDEGQASFHALNHVAESLRWHTRNSLDNNGTKRAIAETGSPDTRERAK
jgi:hypothetical protein